MASDDNTRFFQHTDERHSAKLVGLSGSVEGRTYPLSAGTVMIGRSAECSLILHENGVSKVHAHIIRGLRERGLII